VWERFWTFAACREGARAVVVHTASQTEELEFVGAGAAIAITPAAAARLLSFPAVAYVPIDDAPHSTLAVAWHAERASQLVQVFVATALDVRDREPEIVAAIERPPAPSTAARL
jgi:hypothetical protein